jgi:hypothetical protein
MILKHGLVRESHLAAAESRAMLRHNYNPNAHIGKVCVGTALEASLGTLFHVSRDLLPLLSDEFKGGLQITVHLLADVLNAQGHIDVGLN